MLHIQLYFNIGYFQIVEYKCKSDMFFIGYRQTDEHQVDEQFGGLLWCEINDNSILI